MTAKIRVIDHLHPEDNAMLQALYSRSNESVDAHVERIEQTGSGAFMKKFYVGFSHASIGDCGTTTLFFEGVSMLAAKAIQDWPLYSGQETSTRYIDMARQSIIDPVGTKSSKAILDRWMKFYIEAQEPTAAEVRRRYPKGLDKDEAVYGRAVKARTFDILRGFLPAGMTTQLSWHTNLRQAKDHLRPLRHHPLKEVRDLGCGAGKALHKKYASSGFSAEDFDKTREWDMLVGEEYAYPQGLPRTMCTFNWSRLAQYRELFDNRPRGGVLPHFLADLGTITFCPELDFGSFRDLQRHRNGVCRMPVLTTELGFEQWYLGQLDNNFRREAQQLIEEQRAAIAGLHCEPRFAQYFVAMGFRVQCCVTYALPAAVYVLELRSGKMVHPTLRTAVYERMLPAFKDALPDFKLHIDETPSDWDVRRGNQTITEKT